MKSIPWCAASQTDPLFESACIERVYRCGCAVHDLLCATEYAMTCHQARAPSVPSAAAAGSTHAKTKVR